MAEVLLSWDSVGAAIAGLTHPHGEVVIHDLKSGRIAGLWNCMSDRKIGDASLIDDIPLNTGADMFGPYKKVGTRGEHIKTVSAVLRSSDGEPVGLLCINLDVTAAEHAARYLSLIAGVEAERPAGLFRVDWRERVQELIHAFAAERRKSALNLARPERIEVISLLNDEGLFETRNAINHAACILGISRTSLYNYLRASQRRTKE